MDTFRDLFGSRASSIVERLLLIEKHLFNAGLYIEKFDALQLATMESPDEIENDTFDFHTLPPISPTLNGLEKLEKDLYEVLEEAYVTQQAKLSSLNSEIEQFESYLASKEDILNISDTEIIQGANDKLKTKITVKYMEKRLLESYNVCSAFLDNKLKSYETISSTMDGYIRFISILAQQLNIAYAKDRSQAAVKPKLKKLLSHRYLDTSDVDRSLELIFKLWGRLFFNSDTHLGKHSLLATKSVNNKSRIGMNYAKIGAGCVLLLWSFSGCFHNESDSHYIWRDPTFAIFMCFGDLLLLLWMWGISIFVWRSSGIDFIRLFNLEGTELEKHPRPEEIVYQSAADLSLIFLVAFIIFNKLVRGLFSVNGNMAIAHAIPTLLVVYYLYRLVMPFHSRRYWLRMLYCVLTAPFHPVHFRDGYIGDLLTSLVRVLLPMIFSLAYLLLSLKAWLSNDIALASSSSDYWWQHSKFLKQYLTPFITLIPLWIRLMQCLRRSVESGDRLPHMMNGLKYSSAIAVISFGTFNASIRYNPLWILCFVGATLFQFYWDLTMDWGIIVDKNSRSASSLTFGGYALRETRLLGPSWIYMIVIIFNLLLRFAWTLTLLPVDPTQQKTFYSTLLLHLGPLIAAGEILRRMVWGFFRLEYEQLQVIGSPLVRSEELLFDDIDAAPSTDKSSHDDAHILQYIRIPSGCVGALGTYLKLDVRSSAANARMVESILFASVIISVVVLAAHQTI